MVLRIKRAGMLCWLLLPLMAANAHAQAKPAGSPSRAEIDDKEARDLFKLGKQAFDEGRFERALKYFKESYDLSHRAALLSNIGTALDRLRRDREAVEAYKNYLAQVPDAPNRALIEDRVRIIEGALEREASEPAQSQAMAHSAPDSVPTPEQTAQAQVAREQAEHASAAPANSTTAHAEGGSIVSRWWFWAGVGTVAAVAVVAGVAASSSGNEGTESPALLSSATRVHAL